MTDDLISLFLIALVAAACPLVAHLIPRRLVPETVLLLLAGALLGPHALNAIHLTDSMELLSDLGLAFLFLLAGYEINPSSLTGSQGKRGLATWALSFAVALLVFLFAFQLHNQFESIALAIALTTTALGTLLPILKERDLSETCVGESILAYGTWGELCPVFAMALLLSMRAEWQTVAILVAFMCLCLIAAVVPTYTKKAGHKLYRFLAERAETTSQTVMRVTILLLIALVTFSSLFDLDIVLGSFASGFILRYVIPEGNHALETKLEGMGYGFLIPLFFVMSGAKIDLASVASQPLMLIALIAALFLLRGLPVFIALSTGRDTKDLSSHNRITVALYCTTALPIIVAVTSVAVNAGAMLQSTASVMVAAGAVSVFLMPLLASVTYRITDVKPVDAVIEIAENPRDIRTIIREHVEFARMMAYQKAAMRRSRNAHDTADGAPWQNLSLALARVPGHRKQDAMHAALEFAMDRVEETDEAPGAATYTIPPAQPVPGNGTATAATASSGGLRKRSTKTAKKREAWEKRRKRLAERAVLEQLQRIEETTPTSGDEADKDRD